MPLPGPVTASTWDHASAAPPPMMTRGPTQPVNAKESRPARHSETRTAASRRAPPPRIERRRLGTGTSSIGRALSRARLTGTTPAASAHGSPVGTDSHSSTYSRTPAPPARVAATTTSRTIAAGAPRWAATPAHTPARRRTGRLREDAPAASAAGRAGVGAAERRGGRRSGNRRGAAPHEGAAGRPTGRPRAMVVMPLS